MARIAVAQLMNWIENLKLSSWLWSHPFLVAHLLRITTIQAGITAKEVYPRTFFKTAHLLLSKAPQLQIPQKPHVLFVNPKDSFINSGYIEQKIKRKVKELYIVPISTEHYPKDLSREYFEQNIPKVKLQGAVA